MPIPTPNTKLTLYGIILFIFGLMVIVMVPAFLYTTGRSIIPGIVLGLTLINSGIILVMIDVWLEVKRRDGKELNIKRRGGKELNIK